MTSLIELDLKSVYRSGDQNLFTELYLPILKIAVSYDRAVGFFSAATLESNLQGISQIVKSNGKIRLIIGHPLEEKEFEAVKQGYELRSLVENLDEKLISILNTTPGHANTSIKILISLIASSRLEIKYALRKKGMYHEKIGIVRDFEGNKVAFHGSANETIYGLSEGYNAESVSVFKSWNPEIYKEYGQRYEDGFEALWRGEQLNTMTLSVPSETYETISKLSVGKEAFTDEEKYVKYGELYNNFFNVDHPINIPFVPENINGKTFAIYGHQRKAIQSWISNAYKGILQLSTGSGKTITSIYALTKVYEKRKRAKLNTVLIVSVPYQELAKQWVDNLQEFNIYPVKCWRSKSEWHSDLKNNITDLKMGVKDFFAIVVVNRTMENNEFKIQLEKINRDEKFFIGDECHNHGSSITNSSLPDAYYRLGLSATPFRADNDEVDSLFPNEAKTRILDYYKTIAAEYSLGDAINDGVLCEYNYHIIPVYLDEAEEEEYEYLSKEIGKLISGAASEKNSSSSGKFTALCGKRSRLLGGAKGKLVALRELLRGYPMADRKHSLFYCGEGSYLLEEDDLYNSKIIESVSKELNLAGWVASQFTSNENHAERSLIMDNFIAGSIDALVSMKVLDEGVDVPVCNKAFILSSTRNPRQYIQRRGRVLRKSLGKEYADIYDFVILPRNNSLSSQSLRRAELGRIDDFILLARNRFDAEVVVDKLKLRND